MFDVVHRSLLGTLKLRSVLHQEGEGHVWRSVECSGPLSSRWSGDGGVRLTVIQSYLHSHHPLPAWARPKNMTPTSSVQGLDHGISPLVIIIPPSITALSFRDRYANPYVHINTHQMSEGVRLEGHGHLVQMRPVVFRQMDKQPDRQTTE